LDSLKIFESEKKFPFLFYHLEMHEAKNKL